MTLDQFKRLIDAHVKVELANEQLNFIFNGESTLFNPFYYIVDLIVDLVIKDPDSRESFFDDLYQGYFSLDLQNNPKYIEMLYQKYFNEQA